MKVICVKAVVVDHLALDVCITFKLIISFNSQMRHGLSSNHRHGYKIQYQVDDCVYKCTEQFADWKIKVAVICKLCVP